MKKTITAAALLLGFGASSASAQLQPTDLQGSDTLGDFTRGLVTALGIAPASLRYVGGGSGTGASAIRPASNRQEIAPMSRFLNTTECGDETSGLGGCYVFAKDKIEIYASSAAVAATGCTNLPYSGAVTLTADGSENGTAGLQGPASITFSSWRDVLRLVYGGQTSATLDTSSVAVGSASIPNAGMPNANGRCNYDIRHKLANEWRNLFEGASCVNGSCTAGLKHAFRRDDVSGTTASFLDLLQLSNTTAGYQPFCNGSDDQDADPVRRPCNGNGFNGAGEEVCHRVFDPANPAVTIGYSLGLVLPALIPNNNAYGLASTPPAEATRNCGPSSLGGAAFQERAWTLQDTQRYGAVCPNGVPLSGTGCPWPKVAGSAAGTGFGCIASRNDRPAGSPSTSDARAYNLWLRSGNGNMINYVRTVGTTTQNRPDNHAYYRIHQLGGATGATACRNEDATDQLPCFIQNDQCSLAFAGKSAAGLPAGTAALNVNGLPVNDAAYPLTRDLFFCTLDEFTNVGSQPAAFVQAQQAIWGAFESSSQTVRDQAAAAGFEPYTGTFEFRSCP